MFIISLAQFENCGPQLSKVWVALRLSHNGVVLLHCILHIVSIICSCLLSLDVICFALLVYTFEAFIVLLNMNILFVATAVWLWATCAYPVAHCIGDGARGICTENWNSPPQCFGLPSGWNAEATLGGSWSYQCKLIILKMYTDCNMMNEIRTL